MELVDAKTIITNTHILNYNYLAAEYVMNIYKGCSHGCIYCFARSKYYKIDDFDRVRAKKDALRIIRDDLRRKVKTGVVTTGGVSDPYNPEEREHKLTRNALELLNAFEFGASILTKSTLVTRDIDVLTDIRTHSPVCVSFSITCGEDALCQKIEPYTHTSSERFAAISQLMAAGIPSGVLMDPILPFINDTDENIRQIVRLAKDHGAAYVYASFGVTMEGIQRDYFYEQADVLFPGVSEAYRRRYKEYYRCPSPRTKKLWHVFANECEKLGVVYDMKKANLIIRGAYTPAIRDMCDDTV